MGEFFNNVVVAEHVFVAPPELYWLSPLRLTSVRCHKSTGWEAVQLALPSSLDGTGYLFHNDPLRPSPLSLFIFVSSSLTQTFSLMNTYPPLCLYTHLIHHFSVEARLQLHVLALQDTHTQTQCTETHVNSDIHAHKLHHHMLPALYQESNYIQQCLKWKKNTTNRK